MVLGLKIAKVFRLAPKKIKSKEVLHHRQKITKMLHLDPWAAAVKFGLVERCKHVKSQATTVYFRLGKLRRVSTYVQHV
jgi:hypothetical protein